MSRNTTVRLALTNTIAVYSAALLLVITMSTSAVESGRNGAQKKYTGEATREQLTKQAPNTFFSDCRSAQARAGGLSGRPAKGTFRVDGVDRAAH
ncbi:hypothetical protein [Paraburkholderia strydomiana]|uniref:hypothetical protein n=1 Tax=Paraburkholderia strydomiana TaxID=1245417 RepID=UPI0038BC099F